MRFPRTLTLYAAREVVLYAALGLLGVGAILFTQNALRQLASFGSVGLRASDVLAILGALAWMLSAYAVPVAFLFGVLVSVGRLSADSELTAMRALGVSLGQFSIPFFALALLVSAATAWLMAVVEPNARSQLREVAATVASRGAIVEPGTFRRLDREGRRLLFVDSVAEDGQLEGVLISDRSEAAHAFTVVASKARFRLDADSSEAHLLLEEGDVHFEPADPNANTYRRIAFSTFDYSLNVEDVVGGGPCNQRPEEMTTARIREVLDYFATHEGKPPDCARVKTVDPYRIQYQRRLALPFAPIVFAALGVALGIRRTRGARSSGMLVCIGLVFGYYALLSLGSFLAEEGTLPPAAALWLPNLLFGAASIPLLLRARRAET
jgi:lipopolysaccharide export system permease protein